MLKHYFAAWMLCVFTCVPGAGQVYGQEYPNRTVRIVTGSAAGGNNFSARLIAQGLTSSLGQPVIVENRGGTVVVPAEAVAKAAPDGYTLLIQSGALWIGTLLEKTPYDTLRDFAPITLTSSTPNILVVHPSLPVKSVKELIALAKARPGVLNYSMGSPGSSTHLAGELFNFMAGTNIVRVPFSSASDRMASLVSGEVQLEFATAGVVSGYLKAGRLRAIAVTGAQPSALMPGLPTIAAAGVPGYESVGMTGIFAPAKTPASIVNRLNDEIVRIVNQPDVKQKFMATGVETVGSTPEEFAAKIKAELARVGKVIKATGIHVE